jgi:alkylation response protein AidB-like acyl-CoA dehydrogenase
MTKNFERAARRYRAVFAEIAREAPLREQQRIPPYEQIDWLREAGFGAARIAREAGGDGLSFEELFRLWVELAEADSNIAHALRGHFEFVEVRLQHSDPEVRAFWVERIVRNRELVGNAWSEKSNEARRSTSTSVSADAEGRLLLNGTKHFSTGTLYADWVDVLADVDGKPYSVVVSTTAPGVERIDDWNGFGQTLTGTGTTHFRDVVVERRHIDETDFLTRRTSREVNVFQLVLLAVLVGIARRAFEELKEYVRSRAKPVFGGDDLVPPAQDGLIQLDIGRVAGALYAAESVLFRAARALDAADRARDDETAQSSASLETYKAQIVVIPAVLDVTSRIFDAVGASATSTELGLDRHWRNARIISSHNSIRYRERNIGAFELFGSFGPREPGDHPAAHLIGG